MKRLLVLIVVFSFLLSGCQMKNNQPEDTSTFSLSDLLIDYHELLGKCPYWNMDWETLKEQSPPIQNTYLDSYPGAPDRYLMYSESEGITYVIDDNYIVAIILTNDTYGLHARIRVGDALTQTLINQYNLECFGKNAPVSSVTIMTGVDRKSSQKLDYDCVFSGTTFISQEESDLFMENFLENINVSDSSFCSVETGIAVSFYVKEGIIVGICMEYIV